MPTVRETVAEMVQYVFPQYAGAPGQIYGGRMMDWIATAGTLAASRVARGPVTVGAMDEIDFLHPVRVGEIAILRARVEYVGRTSLEVGVRVFSENPATGERHVTLSSHMVFVAIDEAVQPRPVGGAHRPRRPRGGRGHRGGAGPARGAPGAARLAGRARARGEGRDGGLPLAIRAASVRVPGGCPPRVPDVRGPASPHGGRGGRDPRGPVCAGSPRDGVDGRAGVLRADPGGRHAHPPGRPDARGNAVDGGGDPGARGGAVHGRRSGTPARHT